MDEVTAFLKDYVVELQSLGALVGIVVGIVAVWKFFVPRRKLEANSNRSAGGDDKSVHVERASTSSDQSPQYIGTGDQHVTYGSREPEVYPLQGSQITHWREDPVVGELVRDLEARGAEFLIPPKHDAPRRYTEGFKRLETPDGRACHYFGRPGTGEEFIAVYKLPS